ncbi:cytochrome c [Desulfuromonas sp.]|uniref:c-type cytochrome n=1 Tax=Desulfuromonas sp. TaxID=892 RepID=UPI0025C0146A|nr:cytochrome c [Desulfuromonas sp.]
MDRRALATLLVAASASLILAAPLLGAEPEDRALELINAQGCRGCHSIGGQGGSLGPALDGVGARLDSHQVMRQLTDPKALNEKSLMPSYKHLPQENLTVIADYLAGLK